MEPAFFRLAQRPLSMLHAGQKILMLMDRDFVKEDSALILLKPTEYFLEVPAAFIGRDSSFRIKWQKSYLNMTQMSTASNIITN